MYLFLDKHIKDIIKCFESSHWIFTTIQELYQLFKNKIKICQDNKILTANLKKNFRLPHWANTCNTHTYTIKNVLCICLGFSVRFPIWNILYNQELIYLRSHFALKLSQKIILTISLSWKLKKKFHQKN